MRYQSGVMLGGLIDTGTSVLLHIDGFGDGSRPAVPCIFRKVDRGHATRAELPLDFIAVADRGLDAGEEIGHWVEI